MIQQWPMQPKTVSNYELEQGGDHINEEYCASLTNAALRGLSALRAGLVRPAPLAWEDRDNAPA